MPFLASRVATLSLKNDQLQAGGPLDVYGKLRRLFFDTALSASRPVFACLRELVPRQNILFGTDYPFAPDAHVKTTVDGLADAVQEECERVAIERDNALVLFPRLRKLVATS
jgi:predicted TIM-barrel fold metal-dependent hydrolase